jgi:lysophospholipid acyltransferase (LPLAT)-like uncharacterized protein
MLKKYRYSILTKPMLFLLYYIIRIYSWTFRLLVENEKEWMDYLKSGGSILLCCWHQQFFSAIRRFKSYESFQPSLMISKSKDGDIIATVAEYSGWYIVRGSSSKGGGEALKGMIKRLEKTRLAAHIVDGPRGPSGVVKAGVISIARATHAKIIPFFASADRAWYFNSWDKFMMPKPFATVTLHFGNMMDLDAEQDFESQRLHLESTMLPGLIP